jgi:protein SCO1
MSDAVTSSTESNSDADAVAPVANSLGDGIRRSNARGVRFTVFVLSAFMLTVVLLFINKITTPRILSPLELGANGAHVFEKGRILKDIDLVTQDGQSFTVAALEGKWTLVFLGFTHCPDICPTTLATLRDAYNKLRPDFREEVQVVLLSADPRRDTQEVLSPYIQHFHQDFTALTGDFLKVKRLAGQLNMAFVKVMQDEGYTVDHSANIALINPHGHYQGFIKPPLQSSRIQLVLQSVISQWQG